MTTTSPPPPSPPPAAPTYPPQWADCSECGRRFDLEVEGCGTDHDDRVWCDRCSPAHACRCQHCDPDGATDAALDAVRAPAGPW